MQHVTLLERTRARHELPWVFTYLGYILLAAIGSAAALVALLALRAV
jgi:hypothetical protein